MIVKYQKKTDPGERLSLEKCPKGDYLEKNIKLKFQRKEYHLVKG